MKVLVTGGAGYIGSHTIVEMMAAGMEPVIVDNFSNSQPEVLERLREITGRTISFREADVSDPSSMRSIFAAIQPEAVIHFAAHKAVSESVQAPSQYYRNNLGAVLTVAEMMIEFGTPNLVFSSSATVYGDPKQVPVTEDAPLRATNPYGQTKLMGEQILRDMAAAYPSIGVTILRYFNPVGAHESGLIGENPTGQPNNIMPMIAQVAAGIRDNLLVYGNDYPTADGTGVRDYIHVVDLSKAHIRALLKQAGKAGVCTYNLGAGQGYSVLELVKAFEQASGKKIKCVVAPRRDGDVAACFADPTLAKRELGWEAAKTLSDMCADVWRWQANNPNGYLG